MRFGVLFLLLLNGCTSSNFEVTDKGSNDTGPGDVATSDTEADADAGPDDTPCVPLEANPATIHVNAQSRRASVGSEECPFKTIAEALAVPTMPMTKRTIKVHGASGMPVVYSESSALILKDGVSVVGDGPDLLTVTGGGPCSTTGDATCVFVLEGGSSLAGVKIEPSIARGIMLVPVAGTSASVESTVVSGGSNAVDAAVLVAGKGFANLGPELKVRNNAGRGLIVNDSELTTVTASSFDANGWAGIVVSSGAVAIGGGQALGNKLFGVQLSSPKNHTINGFVARDNNTGVYVEGVAGLKMRHSTLVKNRYGLEFRSTGDLDLGQLGDYGDNTFGGKSAYNTKAGICIPVVRSAKSPAVGNKFLVCEPTRLLVPSGGCDAISGYQDVYYAAATLSDPPPLDWSACDAGP